MSFDNEGVFTKENLDFYLKELAKEYRKRNGKGNKIEIILIGGASILIHHGFRDMTMDIDALIQGYSSIKDVINHVGDRFHLPNGWLNADFMKTRSYSPKLFEVSKYYKTFYNVLEVRTIEREYLIAMKLCAGRRYKNDLSDILGILAEWEDKENPITMEAIDLAIKELYVSWDNIPADSIQFMKDAFQTGNFKENYKDIKKEEKNSKDILMEFEEQYPKVLKESNLNDILNSLKQIQENGGEPYDEQ